MPGSPVDAAAIADAFRRDGIVLLPGLLDPEAAEALAAALEAALAERPLPRDAEYARRFDMRVDVAPVVELPEVVAAFALPAVHAATAAALGHGWMPDIPPLAFSTPPGGGRQGWHQDSADDDPAQHVANRIIYPRGVGPDQGALVIVRGSHRLGDIPAGGNHDDLPGQEELRPAPGTLAIMHSRLWHRVGENVSATARTQVNHRARPATARAGLCTTAVLRAGTWDFTRRGSASDRR